LLLLLLTPPLLLLRQPLAPRPQTPLRLQRPLSQNGCHLEVVSLSQASPQGLGCPKVLLRPGAAVSLMQMQSPRR